jgi:hypothetical protein
LDVINSNNLGFNFNKCITLFIIKLILINDKSILTYHIDIKIKTIFTYRLHCCYIKKNKPFVIKHRSANEQNINKIKNYNIILMKCYIFYSTHLLNSRRLTKFPHMYELARHRIGLSEH